MLEQNYLSGSTSVKIAQSVEIAVATGHLAGGDRLPSVREASQHLGVATATVYAAYRILQERGVVTVEGRRLGTRIRHASPVALPLSSPLPEGVRNLAEGNPDPRLLPDFGAALKRVPHAPRLYGDDLNHAPLLAIAREQFAADKVPAANVAVVSGALDGIERVLREHLRPGDRVLVEDPAFTGVLDLLHALSLTPVPVAVDDEGLLPDALLAAMREADALIATPRAQNPTGAAFSEKRARRLTELLRRRPELLVIEDDHAGPVAGARYRTLVEPSRERWAVVRSVSKSLGPDLRVALVAADARTHARVEGRQTLGIRWVSHILQTIVAALLRDRPVQRKLAAAEKSYTARRTALIAALRERGFEAHGVSGLNVWIALREESAVVQSLMQRGWAVQAGERYRLKSSPAIRVTIAALDEGDAVRFATDLAAATASGSRSSSA